MRKRLLLPAFAICIVGGIVFFLIFHKISPSISPVKPKGPYDAQIYDVQESLLESMMNAGLNKNNGINNGLGTLWKNWTMNSQHAIQGNVNITSTSPNSLSDIIYLNILLTHQKRYSLPNLHDAIASQEAIVKQEISDHTAMQPEAYPYLEDIAGLTNDQSYAYASTAIAENISTLFDSIRQTVFDQSSDHPNGFYQTQKALAQGSDLLTEGLKAKNPTYIQEGQQIISFVYTHSFIQPYNVLPDTMDSVIAPDGNPNSDEALYPVHAADITFSQEAASIQILLSLFQLTHESMYLTDAQTLLTPFLGTKQTTWDTINLGYYPKAILDGDSQSNPGNITVTTDTKSPLTQSLLLQAIHQYNQIASYPDNQAESSLLQVVLHHAYSEALLGVPNSTTAEWTGGVTIDTQSMLYMLEALLAYNVPVIQLTPVVATATSTPTPTVPSTLTPTQITITTTPTVTSTPIPIPTTITPTNIPIVTHPIVLHTTTPTPSPIATQSVLITIQQAVITPITIPVPGSSQVSLLNANGLPINNAILHYSNASGDKQDILSASNGLAKIPGSGYTLNTIVINTITIPIQQDLDATQGYRITVDVVNGKVLSIHAYSGENYLTLITAVSIAILITIFFFLMYEKLRSSKGFYGNRL